MPRKSACVFCPYTDNRRWQEMRRDDPASFDAACAADEALRDQSSSGMRSASFVHRSLKPLREVDFDHLLGDDVGQETFDWNRPELDGLAPDGFSAECEGMCGV